MKAEIYRLHPELEFADDSEETLRALISAAKEAQHSIDQAILSNLATAMPKRIDAIKDANGQYTKY